MHNSEVYRHLVWMHDDQIGIASSQLGLRNCNYLIFTDVDECSEGVHTCDHTCVNINGTYYCQCDDGYILRDGFTCRRKCFILEWIINWNPLHFLSMCYW